MKYLMIALTILTITACSKSNENTNSEWIFVGNNSTGRTYWDTHNIKPVILDAEYGVELDIKVKNEITYYDTMPHEQKSEDNDNISKLAKQTNMAIHAICYRYNRKLSMDNVFEMAKQHYMELDNIGTMCSLKNGQTYNVVLVNYYLIHGNKLHQLNQSLSTEKHSSITKFFDHKLVISIKMPSNTDDSSQGVNKLAVMVQLIAGALLPNIADKDYNTMINIVNNQVLPNIKEQFGIKINNLPQK